MTATSAFTRYDFSFEIQPPSGGAEDDISFSFTGNQLTDDMAFALIAAFQGLDWAAGTTVQTSLLKQDVTDVVYTTDLTSTPPTFS